MTKCTKFLAIILFGFPVFLLGTDTSRAEFVGFGSVTRGAEDCTGYTTVHVTTLSEGGSGSLRDAVSEDCRYVVFDVGGDIVLTRPFGISQSYITIDGSSAPSPGITLITKNVRTAIEARSRIGPVHDVIVHNIRVIGSGVAKETSDIWELDGQSRAVYNIILDHITASASSDGIFDIWGRVYDVSISHNLITDTLLAQHLSRSTPPVRERISFYGNVYARNNERQPKFKYDNHLIDFVNNVVYGWGWMEGGASGLRFSRSSNYETKINVENNIYHFTTEASHGRENQAIVLEGRGPLSVFYAGNDFPDGENDVRSTVPHLSIPPFAQVQKHAVTTLGDIIVPCAGTLRPTPEEEKFLRDISIAVGGRGGSCQHVDKRPNPPSSVNTN